MNAISKPQAILAVVIMLVAALFQIVGLVRYSNRLPDDWVGLGLYAATIVGVLAAAALIAFGRRGGG